MTEVEKDWRDRMVKVASESRDRDSALWVSSQLVTEFKEALRKAIRQKEQDFIDDEIDEVESGIITGYRNCLKLIDEVLPPKE